MSLEKVSSIYVYISKNHLDLETSLAIFIVLSYILIGRSGANYLKLNSINGTFLIRDLSIYCQNGAVKLSKITARSCLQ